MNGLFQIFIGSFLLSIVHALIPSHWLPMVAIGRSENWSRRETLSVTAITAIAHTISTIIIGIVVGFIGYELSESYHFISHTVAPVILIVLGLFFLYQDYMHEKVQKHHEHSHVNIDKLIKKKKDKRAIITTLSIAMFFSPCIEVEVYYFTAARIGWLGILTVSVVYFVVTILGMLFLVNFAAKGVEKLKMHFLEHREKLISGIILILVGLLAYFVEF